MLQRLAWGLLWQLRYSDWMWKHNSTQVNKMLHGRIPYGFSMSLHDRMSVDFKICCRFGVWSILSSCLALNSHQMLPRTEGKREKERTWRRKNQKEKPEGILQTDIIEVCVLIEACVSVPTTWVFFLILFAGEPEVQWCTDLQALDPVESLEPVYYWAVSSRSNRSCRNFRLWHCWSIKKGCRRFACCRVILTCNKSSL